MYYQVYREFILEIYKKEKYKQIKGSEKVLNIYLDLKYDSSFKTLICSIELRRWLKLILKAINIMIHYNLLNELLAMLNSITLSQCFRTLKKLKLFFLMLYIGSNEKSQNYELSIDLARKVCTDAVTYYPGEKYSFLLALSSGSKERQMNANTRSKLLKYLRRKIDSNVQDYYTYYFYGHLRSLSKSYTLAIKSFQQALNQLENQQVLTNSQLEAKRDNQAQLYLYLAITHFHEAIKRTSNNRQYEILLGFSYLKKYAKLKNYTQQVYFNLARAYHHFNLLPMAVKHYKKVLQLSEMEEIEDRFDLKFEAAYNLSSLFLSVNNHPLAYYYRIKYLKY
ncbi:hypothetical protein K502DRAFT_11202 [Neoconidiobolus thromboides FSU 785]|nr:hypothetical protein K502DRAFT_11202 [Neoconidiobolus thromboides FSU 785]